jgi:hypothetical protein
MGVHELLPGNAKITGLERDLGMKGTDFNIALTVFYIFVRINCSDLHSEGRTHIQCSTLFPTSQPTLF